MSECFRALPDSRHRVENEQTDRRRIEGSTPGAPSPQLFEQVADDPNGQRSVQQRQVQIEGRSKRHRCAKNRRKDNRRVAEDHRHDESEEDSVEHRVVHQPRR